MYKSPFYVSDIPREVPGRSKLVKDRVWATPLWPQHAGSVWTKEAASQPLDSVSEKVLFERNVDGCAGVTSPMRKRTLEAKETQCSKILRHKGKKYIPFKELIVVWRNWCTVCLWVWWSRMGRTEGWDWNDKGGEIRRNLLYTAQWLTSLKSVLSHTGLPRFYGQNI